MEEKTTIQQIVSAYRTERGNGSPLPYRQFAEELKAGIPNLSDLNFQSINQWEVGRHEPNVETLLYIFCMTHDWRRDFAADLMAAKMPSSWSPNGEIGRRILGGSHATQTAKAETNHHKSANAD